MLKQTRTLVYLSFMVALSVVLSRILSVRFSIGGVEGIRIGLGALPMILSGIAFGPLAGGIVGALADVVGYVINPMGAYAPHFTFSAFLTGFIPGAIIHYIFKNNTRYELVLGSIIVGESITKIFLVPFFLHSLFGLPMVSTAIPQIFVVLIQSPIYAYLIRTILSFSLFKVSTATGGKHK